MKIVIYKLVWVGYIPTVYTTNSKSNAPHQLHMLRKRDILNFNEQPRVLEDGFVDFDVCCSNTIHLLHVLCYWFNFIVTMTCLI